MNVLYKDEDIIVVEKPAGMATQTAGVASKDMISEIKKYLLINYRIRNAYVGVIHRLDQPVRGILVFALNERAASNLSKQIIKHEFEKYYYAVVNGIINREDEITIVDYLVKDSELNKAIIVDRSDCNGKRAELTLKRLDTDTNKNLSVLEVNLITGRFHQIRCQLSNYGYPIVNDEKYGAPIKDNKNNNHSIALCAYKLSFKHPKNSQNMMFSLDLKSCEFLDKYR